MSAITDNVNDWCYNTAVEFRDWFVDFRDWLWDAPKNIWQFLRDNIPPLLSLFGGIIAAVVGYKLSVPYWEPRWPVSRTEWAFVIGLLMTLAGGIGSLVTAPGIQRMRREHAELKKNDQDRIRDLLIELTRDLGFGFDERISVYIHYKNTFALHARYSKNNIYSRNGRPVYPERQGCIGKAWMQGFFFVDGLPDPSRDLQLYLREARDKSGMGTTAAKKMKMKSRNYGGFVLSDPKTANSIGVIIFESMKSNKFSTADIQRVKSDLKIARIEDFLKDAHGVMLARENKL